MSTSTFYLKQHDLLPVLSVRPTDGDGIVVPIADGAPVVFNMRSANRSGIKITRAAAVASGGVLTYAWVTGDTDTAGTFFGEFEWNNSGKPETFPNYDAGKLIVEIAGDIG